MAALLATAGSLSRPLCLFRHPCQAFTLPVAVYVCTQTDRQMDKQPGLTPYKDEDMLYLFISLPLSLSLTLSLSLSLSLTHTHTHTHRYWQASSLLLITVMLNIGEVPISSLTGFAANLSIACSLLWWQDLNDEMGTEVSTAARIFGLWRPLALSTALFSAGTHSQLPFSASFVLIDACMILCEWTCMLACMQTYLSIRT